MANAAHHRQSPHPAAVHSPRPSPDRAEPAGLLPARPIDPLPEDETIRRWRVQQIRRALDRGLYDEEQALDGALEKLAADLGVKLDK